MYCDAPNVWEVYFYDSSYNTYNILFISSIVIVVFAIIYKDLNYIMLSLNYIQGIDYIELSKILVKLLFIGFIFYYSYLVYVTCCNILLFIPSFKGALQNICNFIPSIEVFNANLGIENDNLMMTGGLGNNSTTHSVDNNIKYINCMNNGDSDGVNTSNTNNGSNSSNTNNASNTGHNTIVTNAPVNMYYLVADDLEQERDVLLNNRRNQSIRSKVLDMNDLGYIFNWSTGYCTKGDYIHNILTEIYETDRHMLKGSPGKTNVNAVITLLRGK